MSDVFLVLGLATFLHYFGIFTFHTQHYWSLLFLLAAVDFFFETWRKNLKEKSNKGENK